MNCTDCREILVLGIEGNLDADTASALDQHLTTCAACRSEKAALEHLHQQITARAEKAAGVALVTPVMARIHAASASAVRPSFGRFLSLRWLYGLGTATAAAAVLALIALSPQTKAEAAQVMTRGAAAAAGIRTVYLNALLRTSPADNFSSLKADAAFSPIQLWKEFAGQKRWRVEKPGRVAVMDGETTLLFMRAANTALRVPRVTESAFDTSWLHRMADIEQTLSHALKMAQSNGWKMELRKETDAAGAVHALVTIDAFTGVPPGDYLTNKLFDVADTRRVYRFDDATGQLEAVQVYLRSAGDFHLVFEVTDIAYNEPIPADVFQVPLPENVAWIGEAQPVANNGAYAAMSAPQAARAFFEACSREDWNEAQVFLPMPVTDRIKQFLGGVTLLNLGEPFTSAATTAEFVPYEIRLRDGNVKKHNLALKKHPRANRWMIDGGI